MNGIRPLKSLAPHICPQCKAKDTFTIQPQQIMCRQCGYVLRHEDGYRMTADEAIKVANDDAESTRRSRYKPTHPINATARVTHIGPVNNWARAAFDTGMENVHRQNWEEAVNAFKRAIDYQHDFTDPHLWIARITTDIDEKRDHLENVLAYQSNHIEALREMMILNGQLSAQANRLNEYAQPELRDAGGAVSTETENLRCSVCGSPALDSDAMTGLPVCQSCGAVNEHLRDDKTKSASEISNLTIALIEKRSQPIKWVIGDRMLHCDSCGAERTIKTGRMSTLCPFCGSNHVIIRDALDSFQQPDGIIPFRLNRDHAIGNIEKQLQSWAERFKRFFNDNTIKRKRIAPYFLPFWMFDAIAQVRITITTRDSEAYRYGRTTQQETTLMDGAFDVPVCGVTSPSHMLTDKLGKFNMKSLKPYNPKFLAQIPAEIYSIDFDEASLEARTKVNQLMREKHWLLQSGTSEEKVVIFPMVQSMEFQLVLMPVWVATLYEADDDVRTALVNGQTGQVALGKAKKPSSPH